MFQMHRLLVAGAVVAGSLWFAPSLTSATTGSCLIPSAAVSQYLSVTGANIVNNLSSDVNICKNQCQQLRNGCLNVVKSAVRCVKASTKADLDAQSHGCNDLSGESKQSCKSSVSSNRKGIADFINGDRQSAETSCENAFESCLADCTQSED
jgi:hypothetical protein